MITRNGKHTDNTSSIFEGMPQTLVQGAGESATKVAEAVEQAGARVVRSAGQMAKTAGAAGAIVGQVKGRRDQMRGTVAGRRGKLRPSGDAMLKAQLAKTSRELANESSDLNAAVESLNKIIKSNRRAAAKGRTRLLSGLMIGAALMYHLDAEHGRERRAATARMVNNMMRGERNPQTPIV